MNTLKLFKPLDRIDLKGSNEKYYNMCFEESWEEIIQILKDYDIILPNPYQIIFGDKYTIKTTTPTPGGNESNIFIDGHKIARVYSSGSNVCDTDLYLVIYFDRLKSLYTKN